MWICDLKMIKSIYYKLDKPINKRREVTYNTYRYLMKNHRQMLQEIIFDIHVKEEFTNETIFLPRSQATLDNTVASISAFYIIENLLKTNKEDDSVNNQINLNKVPFIYEFMNILPNTKYYFKMSVNVLNMQSDFTAIKFIKTESKYIFSFQTFIYYY
jgi:hypothetical protein